MVYNVTHVANVTGMLHFLQNVNTYILDGFLGIGILFSLFLIFASSFYYFTRDAKNSFMASSFIVFILSIFLRALEFVPNKTLFITLIFCAAVVAFSWKE